MKRGALVNFTKFTGKQLCQSLFFNKAESLRAATLFKKKLRHSCFPVNLAKFLKPPYLQNTSARLRLILYVASFLYFLLSKIFASKKVASCEKNRLVENRLNGYIMKCFLKKTYDETIIGGLFHETLFTF